MSYSWLPLLFIPTNASPIFIISFVALTYILHRPCIYCSALLLILFISSCHWSDQCFFDFRGDWFSPRFGSQPPATTNLTAPLASYNQSSAGTNANAADANNMTLPCDDGSLAGFVFDAINTTTSALAGAAVEEMQRRLVQNGSSALSREAWTGIGLEWLRSLLGRREWTLPCVNVKVRL